ncbi:MAG: aminotransferase class V-fold PLP-dependent enzyme [Campylobacterota bacterium]
MTINFNAKQRQYEAHKEAIDELLLKSLTQEKATCTSNTLQLEKDIAAYVGSNDAIVCNTQFNAFVLLFMVLDLKAGDEVITSPLGSGIAVQAALFMGARVIFADVNKNDYTLDIEQVEDAITERTKLVIPISLFGNIADMSAVNALAEQHDLCVIEDAAESFGSRKNTRHSCQLSKLAVTSFYPDMPLHGFGNGAALFIADDGLRSKARVLRSQGRENGNYTAIGIEACIDEAQAAVVDFKLSIFDEEIAKRKSLAENYTEKLQECDMTLPDINSESNYAFYPIRLSNRQAVIEKLEQADVQTKTPFNKPLHLEEAFSFMRYVAGDFPVSEEMADELLLLPLNAYMTEDEQNKIISLILER